VVNGVSREFRTGGTTPSRGAPSASATRGLARRSPRAPRGRPPAPSGSTESPPAPPRAPRRWPPRAPAVPLTQRGAPARRPDGQCVAQRQHERRQLRDRFAGARLERDGDRERPPRAAAWVRRPPRLSSTAPRKHRTDRTDSGSCPRTRPGRRPQRPRRRPPRPARSSAARRTRTRRAPPPETVWPPRD